MTPADLSRTVLRAVRRAVDEDALRAPVPARVRVERTRPGGSGDYACAVALQLAGPAALPAREVAGILRERMTAAPGVGRVEITGPGFLNFHLDDAAEAAARAALVHETGRRGIRYGWADGPTGQVHQLHHRREVRAAVVADAVARLLRARGALVRTTCEEAPDPDWARLGVTVDAYGRPPAPLRETRPVPAGATAGELLERLGPDAARWGLLRPATHDRAPLDGSLLVQAEGNPLFLVRYAHARARALTRGARLLGFTAASPQELSSVAEEASAVAGELPPVAGERPASEGKPPAPAGERPASGEGTPAPAEQIPDPAGERSASALHTLLADHPGVLADAARHQAPDRLARHLETVAAAFLDFHDTARPLPVGDEKPSAAHRSRLALAEAAGTVLAGGLALLGISAPEHL
ncbi:arginine--tRNA ligase [Streptomyces nitrosporeus]|uniref:arginine--tRNA ligase n=1 Tax=Streptomyces nitrosporeus TaxID=28894 RepID=A0A5J6F9A6_9ACTN|nr:DALR anticodon-binding domain-containing protein [Streptomyces nitrosporeus]QEU72297.1 arginine--tRNA ligase [Streptomyces nitrosporeus]GGY79009.1 hypothetical protein GCM10010327_06700 [Streptomyces nitrosporeus]